MAELVLQVRSLADRAQTELQQKYEAREKALQLAREVQRLSSNAIQALHRGEEGEARARLGQARGKLEEIERLLADHRDIYYAGFVEDAAKEYAEAWATLAFITRSPLPQPEEMGVNLAPYLKGLGEAMGELRRHLLDSLRRGDTDRCEEMLAIMDEVYRLLMTLEFPDAVTGGLRRISDNLRGILERTRGDLTLALCQRQLEERLEAFRQSLANRSQGG